MERPLSSMTLKGFKSIASLERFPLGDLNILIGANGAGKSNFIDAFRMLRALANQRLQQFVNEQGGGDGFFFLGPKATSEIELHLDFGLDVYELRLTPTAQGSLQIAEEVIDNAQGRLLLGTGTPESMLTKCAAASRDEGSHDVAMDVYSSLSRWTVYHFHDTSALAPMRRDRSVRDWEYLRDVASNLAPFLLHLQEHNPSSYSLIRDAVRLCAPFFDDFLLRPQLRGAEEVVRLEWRQKGSDFPFQPYHLSDGTIRFVSLATALLQPNLPAIVVIDEPELGLHPYAISVVAGLIKSAAGRTQIVAATQSPLLLDYFEPEDIVVLNREKGRSTFDRLDAANLAEWLEEYSVGELWHKNVVRGGPIGE